MDALSTYRKIIFSNALGTFLKWKFPVLNFKKECEKMEFFLQDNLESSRGLALSTLPLSI